MSMEVSTRTIDSGDLNSDPLKPVELGQPLIQLDSFALSSASIEQGQVQNNRGRLLLHHRHERK